MNDDDVVTDEYDEGHRRDLSRCFLIYLRKAARLRVDYREAMSELADVSQIQRHGSEDDFQDRLESDLDRLIEKCPDPSCIESEISETDATWILQSQGAFEPHASELDEDAVALLEERLKEAKEHPERSISSEVIWARMQAHIQERKRTVWKESFGDREKALGALRWSGFRGPIFEAYWNDALAWISFSVGNNRQFMSTGMQVGGFVDAADAARKILGATTFASPIGIMHSEELRVTVERLLTTV